MLESNHENYFRFNGDRDYLNFVSRNKRRFRFDDSRSSVQDEEDRKKKGIILIEKIRFEDRFERSFSCTLSYSLASAMFTYRVRSPATGYSSLIYIGEIVTTPRTVIVDTLTR